MPIRNILVVEDSPTDLKYLTDILVKKGYHVSTAETGEEALAKAKQLQPDLVLMDIVLPGQNGYQATRELSKDASTKHIPVIICTTKGQETDRVWGMRQGAKDYIVKPVSQARAAGENCRTRIAWRREHPLRDYQRELAERLRGGEGGRTSSKLGMQVGRESWLVDLADAGEVIPVPPITPVPLTRPWFRGVTNIRGNLYSVVDFPAFLGGAPR